MWLRTDVLTEATVILIIIATSLPIVEGQRICELQGSCYQCEHDRYSFYACNVDSDCFREEYCNPQRFCCPLAFVAPVAAFRHDEYYSQPSEVGSANFEFHFRPAASSIASLDIAQPSRCPDGVSYWQRMCRTDEDCIFRDEICADGKCCPSCEHRRAQTLGRLRASSNTAAAQSPNLERSKFNGFGQLTRGAPAHKDAVIPSADIEAEEWGGVYIPQCFDDDARLYRAMQCANGTNDCFCVTRYGRRLSTGNINETPSMIDCGAERVKSERHNTTALQKNGAEDNSTAALIESLKDDLRRTTEKSRNHFTETKDDRSNNRDAQTDAPDSIPASNSTADVLEIGEGTLKRASLQNSSGNVNDEFKDSKIAAPPSPCTDPLREWKLCGSACPISCATRTRASCAEDHCRRGCFCRLPYVVFDANNARNSRCVLPSECPMLAFTPADNDALNNFFESTPPRSHWSSYPRIGANRDGDFNGITYNVRPTENHPIVPVNRCADPLKNFLTCGSGCPQGCGRLGADCGARCVVGCFCRVPYVLRDPNDIASACILPQHCAPSVDVAPTAYGGDSAAAEMQCNGRPGHRWHHCASKSRCTRSCAYLSATTLNAASMEARRASAACASVECRAGCECIPPLVLRGSEECVAAEACATTLHEFAVAGHDDEEEDGTTAATWSTMPREFFTRAGPSAPEHEVEEKRVSSSSSPPPTLDWRDVEMEKCARQLNKVFRSCASSCPLACDNDELRWCTPCVSGCFCRNGFVFVNSSNWRESACIRRSECSIDGAGEDETTTNAAQPELSTANDVVDGTTIASTAEEVRTTDAAVSIISALPDECPQETADLSGRTCEHDFECGFQQKCCGPSSNRRCTCVDAHAIWLECGTVCAEYCRLDDAVALPSVACPKICRPGCYCASGYIRRAVGGGANSATECISIAKCLAWRAAASIQAHHARYSNSHDESNSRQLGGGGGMPYHVEVGERSVRQTIALAIDPRVTSPSFLWSVRHSTSASSDAGEKADACGEALASGVLYAPGGARIGRMIIRPQRRESSSDDDTAIALHDSLIRLTGELRLDVLQELNGTAGAQIYLAVYQFSDTTVNGCQELGEPIPLRLVDEDKNGFVVSTATTNIYVGRTPPAGNKSPAAAHVDRVFAWRDRIAPGTNPLIGHSIVLKAFTTAESPRTKVDESTKLTARPLACAILGIVPSC